MWDVREYEYWDEAKGRWSGTQPPACTVRGDAKTETCDALPGPAAVLGLIHTFCAGLQSATVKAAASDWGSRAFLHPACILPRLKVYSQHLSLTQDGVEGRLAPH